MILVMILVIHPNCFICYDLLLFEDNIDQHNLIGPGSTVRVRGSIKQAVHFIWYVKCMGPEQVG